MAKKNVELASAKTGMQVDMDKIRFNLDEIRTENRIILTFVIENFTRTTGKALATISTSARKHPLLGSNPP